MPCIVVMFFNPSISIPIIDLFLGRLRKETIACFSYDDVEGHLSL